MISTKHVLYNMILMLLYIFMKVVESKYFFYFFNFLSIWDDEYYWLWLLLHDVYKLYHLHAVHLKFIQCCRSVQLIQSPVMSDSSQPHGLQHARLTCPSPTPRACLNSCPSSQWCHSTISSSVVPFSSRLQSFPASGSFPMSEFFAPGGHSIGVSTSALVLLMNIQDWFPLGLTGWISLQSKWLSRVFSNTTVQKHQFFGTQLS